MARTLARLPQGARMTDYISLGVVAQRFPRSTVERVLRQSGRASRRQRHLPAHVVVYYVIALALYMQVSYREVLRCLLEGLQWLRGARQPLPVTGHSGISQARTRLGWEPLEQLHDELLGPLAGRQTKGAFYRRWRLVSLDGSTLDVADEKRNREACGRPGTSRGSSAFPQIRFVSLVENGTHVLFASRLGAYATGEITLAKQVLPALKKDMLCLADRNFLGYSLWQQAQATGAALLWRGKKHLRLAVQRRLLSEPALCLRAGPAAPDSRHRGAGDRLSARRSAAQRAFLSLADDDSGPRRSAGQRVGGAVSGALGDRNRAR